jgi:hypothetical protein
LNWSAIRIVPLCSCTALVGSGLGLLIDVAVAGGDQTIVGAAQAGSSLTEGVEQIGFSERSGYTAIGTVCNVAARLCAEAKDGQILISQRVAARLNESITLEDIGALTLKGLTQPVVAYNVLLAASQPALRVIEGGPPSA